MTSKMAAAVSRAANHVCSENSEGARTDATKLAGRGLARGDLEGLDGHWPTGGFESNHIPRSCREAGDRRGKQLTDRRCSGIYHSVGLIVSREILHPDIHRADDCIGGERYWAGIRR